MNKQFFQSWLNTWIETRQKNGIKDLEKLDYQYELIWEMINDVGKLRYVLAAAPNSGKTLMLIIFIDWRVFCNPNYRCIVLTHGTQDLRSQFNESVNKYLPNFKNNTNIIINLPHSLKNLDLGFVDDVLVDEAHHYYNAKATIKILEDGVLKRIPALGMVKKIITRLKDKNPNLGEILLTGTPSDFIMHNKQHLKNPYKISFVSVHDLWKLGRVQDVLVEVATSDYNFKIKDYNSEGELITSVKIDKKEMFKTLESIMIRLRSSFKMVPDPLLIGGIPKVKRMLFNSKAFLKNKEDIAKTFIVTRNHEEAGFVNDFLLKYGFTEANILRSTSDQDDNDLTKFKDDPEIKFAIVVYRGILGFNYSELANVVDLTGSRNVNRTFQLYCRLIRTSEFTKDKFYFKVVPKSLAQFFEKYMAGVLHLSHEYFMRKFDGKNFLDLPLIPQEPKESKKRKNKGDKPTPPPGQPAYIQELGLEYIFEMIPLWYKGTESCESKAYITLRQYMESVDLIRKDWSKISDAEIRQMLLDIKQEFDLTHA